MEGNWKTSIDYCRKQDFARKYKSFSREWLSYFHSPLIEKSRETKKVFYCLSRSCFDSFHRRHSKLVILQICGAWNWSYVDIRDTLYYNPLISASSYKKSVSLSERFLNLFTQPQTLVFDYDQNKNCNEVIFYCSSSYFFKKGV